MEFADKDRISTWAKDAVEFCTEKGYMQGKSNNNFDPKSPITREEMAVVIQRIVNSLQ